MGHNWVRGRRVGPFAVQMSCAPFLFSRGLWVTFRRGFAVRVRNYELAVFGWPFRQ